MIDSGFKGFVAPRSGTWKFRQRRLACHAGMLLAWKAAARAMWDSGLGIEVPSSINYSVGFNSHLTFFCGQGALSASAPGLRASCRDPSFQILL